MTRLVWSPDYNFAQGTDRGVLYFDSKTVSWPGLISVEDKESDDRVSSYYFDGINFFNAVGISDLSLTVNSFVYPDELDTEMQFGFTYRTQVEGCFQLHVIYKATATPSSHTYSTLGNSTELEDISFEFETIPVYIPHAKRSSHLVIDYSELSQETIDRLETVMYGDADNEPRLPTPEEIFELIQEGVTFVVIYHGDGSWTAIGPDEMLTKDTDTSFIIDSPSAIPQDNTTYTLESI